jgi:dipeptidyl aminopeptidase/acylaminoacyl peptidase
MKIAVRLPITAAALMLCAAAPVHDFLSVAIAPDGARVASVEGDEDASGVADIRALVVRMVSDGTSRTIALPCGAVHECTPSSPAWAADGRHLSFVLRTPGSHAHAIYTADVQTGALVRRLAFDGTLESLRYGPDGRLSVLATADAGKEVGAVEAGAAMTGVLGGAVHEQRVAILGANSTLHWASPDNLFVYEYDWRPDGHGFIGTAAPGDGDNNWWVARLYAFDGDASARVIYKPADAQQQLAAPVVSPDGQSVAFIGGLMSDFGATGGEAFILPLGGAGKAVDVTPDWPATVTSLQWSCDGHGLLASVLHADQTQVLTLGLLPTMRPPAPSLSVAEKLGGDRAAISTDCRTAMTASVHESFLKAPEIEVGHLAAWHDLTRANAGLHGPARVQSIGWQSGPFTPQGWLLLPETVPPGARLPMVTEVHGGPAWANQPGFVGAGLQRRLLDAGYALFLPNPRGSFGQGEAFTRANVKDFGYGDLRDILAGVGAAEHAAPIDDHRLGLMGWSYGGYMTMFAVTQTQRFRAAVAGAGIANWQSYYGENGIDAWMIPYFGASVYADPAVYAKSSPITFITRVRTPTLEIVGENDIECPAPQTEEFWHALTDLGVTTRAVVYPGEGHHMRDPKHVADYQTGTLAWFGKYLR